MSGLLDPTLPHLLIIDLAISVFWRPTSTESRPTRPAIPPPGRRSSLAVVPAPGTPF